MREVGSTPDRTDRDDLPPRTWRRFYLAVLAELALLVVLFYGLTRWAS